MKDHLISQFIDDELDLDEKIGFVEDVHRDSGFMHDALELLRQEKLLRADWTFTVPPVAVASDPPRRIPVRRALGFAVCAAAAAVLLLFFWPAPSGEKLIPHRFVIYQPGAEQVEITGNFTKWRKIPLRRTGRGGYWEITLDLPPGEHRFSYLLEGRQTMADPTVRLRERDDFGNENSIFEVKL